MAMGFVGCSLITKIQDGHYNVIIVPSNMIRGNVLKFPILNMKLMKKTNGNKLVDQRKGPAKIMTMEQMEEKETNEN